MHDREESWDIPLYVGTYTRGEGEGIYLCRFNTGSGVLDDLKLVAKEDNPTFLALHPNGKWAYAVSETRQSGERTGGAVTAYSRNSDSGELTEINMRGSGGAGPCHVALDRSARVALVANYSAGSISAFTIGPDGALGEAFAFFQHQGSSVNPKRQNGPHAHSTCFSHDNRFAFLCDLGTDLVMIYQLDGDQPALVPADPPIVAIAPGAGPRHMAIHPDGEFVYLINEMGSTVTAFNYEPDGAILRELQTISTLPEGYSGESTTAEVVVSADGRFLYGSNRGHDSIAVFSVDTTSGLLSPIQIESSRGKTPRNFNIDPTGRFLLTGHQDSDSIVVFHRDADTGRLAYAGVTLKVPSPVCLRFG
jgi:6-phosphogluconolactonase